MAGKSTNRLENVSRRTMKTTGKGKPGFTHFFGWDGSRALVWLDEGADGSRRLSHRHLCVPTAVKLGRMLLSIKSTSDSFF